MRNSLENRSRQRRARIKELRTAAAEVDESVSTSRGGVVFWGREGDGGPVGVIVTEYNNNWLWCTTVRKGRVDPTPYATKAEAIRAGLLELARQEEARL